MPIWLSRPSNARSVARNELPESRTERTIARPRGQLAPADRSVLRRQPMIAATTTAAEHLAPAGGAHAGAEPLFAYPFDLAELARVMHGYSCSLALRPRQSTHIRALNDTGWKRVRQDPALGIVVRGVRCGVVEVSEGVALRIPAPSRLRPYNSCPSLRTAPGKSSPGFACRQLAARALADRPPGHHTGFPHCSTGRRTQHPGGRFGPLKQSWNFRKSARSTLASPSRSAPAHRATFGMG